MNHSYEEIRSVALEIISEKEMVSHTPNQYEHLRTGIAEVFSRRENGTNQDRLAQHRLSNEDSEIFLEVFWELFRQGIITLGTNANSPAFPFFRISQFGIKIIETQNAYFFHDIESYTKLINDNIPNIDAVTLIYLQEAMQAFKSSCILSSSVMLGVATEHTFLLMLEVIKSNPTHETTYQNVFDQRTILQKVNKFKNILDQHIRTLPAEIQEDLDTHFAGILSIIRNFRNQAGHPTGKILDREQAYILLQLFIPYCKKIYQLKDHFKP